MLDIIRVARLKATTIQPYLSTAIWRLSPIEIKDFGTMAVDKHWRLYYDPVAVSEKWDINQVAGVILHEVWHLLRSHFIRAKAISAQQKPWNVAADAEINDDLAGEKIALPDGIILPSTFGWPDCKTAEEYYNMIDEKVMNSCSFGNDDAFGGSCADGDRRDYELDPNDKEAPGVGEWENEAIKKNIANEIRKCGDSPGFAKRWAEAVLNPTIDWRKILSSSLRSAMAEATGMIDYSYSRLSRRRIPNIVLPAMKKPIPEVAVVIDTSGSIGDKQLSLAMAEIKGILKTLTKDIRLVICDARVYSNSKVRTLPEVVARIQGGGGTDLRLAFDELDKTRPDFAIIITDCETPWPDKAHFKTIVVRIGHGQAPAWAKVIDVRE